MSVRRRDHRRPVGEGAGPREQRAGGPQLGRGCLSDGRTIDRMTEPERPLRLDAPREEVLAHAAKLVEEAWRSFDRYRPEEPALDERVRGLLGAGLPGEPVSVHEALDDAARILDESIAQPRPRYFAFIGSSGLEIGAIADLLAHTYDINLAVDARAATQIEHQAVRWVSEFVGFPATIGAFTSGGTISNVTALAAAREQALPGARTEGLSGRRLTVYCSAEVHYSITRAVELLGIGSNNLRDLPIDDARRLRPDALAEALDRDIAAGIRPGGRRGHGRDHAHRRDRPDRPDRRRLRRTRRVAPRGRRVRRAGRGGRRRTRRCSAASSAPTRSRSTRTSGCTCRRHAGSCWYASTGRSRGRSRTSRDTCRTSSTSCTPWTSRSSTRGRSAR